MGVSEQELVLGVGMPTGDLRKWIASSQRVNLHALTEDITLRIGQHDRLCSKMANFFDIRARQAAAAATAASSSKQQAPVQDNRLQPWVEK